jgi:hypothetical protein
MREKIAAVMRGERVDHLLALRLTGVTEHGSGFDRNTQPDHGERA